MNEMDKCEICGKKATPPFACNYCNKVFCVDHHLPENHNCLFQPRTPPPYIKARLDSMMKQSTGKKKLRYAMLALVVFAICVIAFLLLGQ